MSGIEPDWYPFRIRDVQSERDDQLHHAEDLVVYPPSMARLGLQLDIGTLTSASWI